MPRLRLVVIGMLLAAFGGTAIGAPASAAGSASDAEVAEITGPVTGGRDTITLASTAFDLEDVGYRDVEYFVEGTATAYTSSAPLTSDGTWDVEPGETADFKTRIVVRTPPKDEFNGTVVLEWLNVSGGVDAAADWNMIHTELIRNGYAWVGVSAQSVGINGGGIDLGGESMALKLYDPDRYGSLVQPGDSFSYDIFSQVGRALQQPGSNNPFKGLDPKRWIAVGESQSAGRLYTYINGVHPLAQVYDGFLVHSRSGGAQLSEPPQAVLPVPQPAYYRDDLDAPVLEVQLETDVLGRAHLSREEDRDLLRKWEVAGTAHYDAYGLATGQEDTGPAAKDPLLEPPVTSAGDGLITCATPVNAGPAVYVLNAAIAHLDAWVRDHDDAPPGGEPIELADPAVPTPALDAQGNVLGGIRTPHVDAPAVRLRGTGQTGSQFCSLFGTTEPLDEATLTQLYPSPQDYVAAVRKATRQAVRRGFVLAEDAPAIISSAKQRSSDLGSTG
jgi:hypothetical protein